jgi:uncharacterized protein
VIPAPGLYTGTLRHRRFSPRPHAFTYGLFMAWLDIDHIPELMARSRWTSYNRFNWAAFDERDHLGDPARPLRERLHFDAQAHGITLPDGPIYLLTHLRYLGYCFNPISFYYCYDRAGALGMVLAEVNSTFGEQRTYWLTDTERLPSASALRYRCAKTMHVSPFMAMGLDYDFVLTEPAGTLVAHMATRERGEAELSPPTFDATLTLEHHAWTPRAVRAVLLRHPWITLKVIVAIHWQALQLYLKRVPVFTHPKHT